jgi:dipeptidyl aminopeptidase/acylaminoacyl peptidase
MKTVKTTVKRALPILLAVCFFPALAHAQANSRPFNPQDMLNVVEFIPGSEPVLSPDGAWVAYATKDPALEPNILSSHPIGFLWAGKLGDKPSRIAEGVNADTPVWSPDGHDLAFVRTSNGRSQLCIWNAASGKVRELGESFPQDDSLWPTRDLAPQWNAKGDAIVFAAVLPAPPVADPESQLVHSTDAVMPGDMPFVDLRNWTLFSVKVANNQARALNPKPAHIENFSLSRDGSQVLYRAVVPDTLDLFRQQKYQEWIVPTNGVQPPRALFKDNSVPAWTVFSSDGRTLLFPEKEALHSIDLDGGNDKIVVEKFPKKSRDPQVSANGLVAVIAARAGTGPPESKMYTILEPTWDILVVKPGEAAPAALTQSEADTQNNELAWAADGKTLFYLSDDEQSYRETIHRWQAGSGQSSVVYSADRNIHALKPSRDGSVLAFTAQSATAPDDGYVVESAKTEARRITDLNPQLSAFAFQEPKMFRFRNVDGVELQAMLFLPPGTDANHKVPVVTWVYEKLSPFKNHFDPDAQWYVTHGYGYLMPDVLVKTKFLAEAYLTCVVPAVNAVQSMDVSTGKYGISGGSLGGLAGLSLISRSDIFSAAVLRAPPSDYFSTWGDGRDRDVWTIEAGQGRADGTPWEQRDVYIDNSSFFHADRVNTPVLIVHGKADFTVPFQQGMMEFAALRALHKNADLLIYRDGDHSIVRGSRFRFVDFHDHAMEWWQRYLH